MVVSSRYDILFFSFDVYLCIGDLDEKSIPDQRQEIKSMIINMLHNSSHKYSNYNSNVKCVDSTIKFISF